jgi:phosphoenolpyruvate synthase/pyruvate phosphate dikinase
MTDPTTITGLAASPGTRRGRARVVRNSRDFHRVVAGEILVTTAAIPELALVFDRIVAFVTDQGGRSAHACVVAREFGIPGVVGTQVATRAIPDGSLVSVDGSAGTVALNDYDLARA